MNKTIALSIATICTALLLGCYMMTPSVRYVISLSEVERPADAQQRYGEQIVEARASTGDSMKYLFEDELVSILWVPTNTRVHFFLTNKSDHSIKIVWDESAFVRLTGQSDRVVHSGVKYSEVNSSQPPTIVPRGGTLEDFILSADQVFYVSGSYGGWREAPLLSYNPNPQEIQSLIGKTFRVLLALQIEGVTNEYTFTFIVDNVLPPANMSKSYGVSRDD